MDAITNQPQYENEPQTSTETAQIIATDDNTISNSQPIPPQTNFQKSKSNPKIAIFIVVCLLVLMLGLAASWLIFGKSSSQESRQTTPTTQSSANTVHNTEAVQPEDITNSIRNTLSEKYTLVDAGRVAGLKKNQISISSQKKSPPYKALGYNFYNSYDGGSELLITGFYDMTESLPYASEVAIRNKIANVYESFGLAKTNSYGNLDSSNLTNVFTNNDIICTVNDPSSPNSTTTASCGLINAYATIAAEIKPFADALPEITETTVLGRAEVKDSVVTGYQNATIGRGDINGWGGYAEILYRKNQGKWQYFTGTQQILNCSRYNTTDLKNAFYGERCMGTTNGPESTVK